MLLFLWKSMVYHQNKTPGGSEVFFVENMFRDTINKRSILANRHKENLRSCKILRGNLSIPTHPGGLEAFIYPILFIVSISIPI